MNDDTWITQALMDNYEERCNGFYDETPEYDFIDFDDEEIEEIEYGLYR